MEDYGDKYEKLLKVLFLMNPNIKKYWDDKIALGIMEIDGKFIGLACLVAGEVADKDGFVRILDSKIL
ncbi:hypothetical protein DRO64_01500 [Candidatus Bathyarchaeota archaeon]|nr:MAG: hypothetical protein DRO64_01500 [Candidatus Bathyarchaeota archaeon]